MAEWGISLFFCASTITYGFIGEALILHKAVTAKHLDKSSNSGNGTPNFYLKKAHKYKSCMQI